MVASVSLVDGRASGILGKARVATGNSFLLLLFVVMILLTLPAQALAGGWWMIDGSDTVGTGIWDDQVDNSTFGSPHGGFSSSSNLCKTCHAVHMAGTGSYRMLKDGSSAETRTQGEGTGTIPAVNGMGNARATECMYCHDATSGATSKKPYELATLPGAIVRGEHTLGVTSIPDSDVNNFGQETGILGRRDPAAGQGRVLQCWQCHSVHGSNTIGTTNSVESNRYESSDSVENWNSKILRLDPANDGSVLAKGSGGLSVATWQGQLNTDGAAVRTGFCADCHNLNPNWEIDSDDTTRPNPRSHPQGPGTDSKMEVYGTTKSVAAHPLEQMGCRGCHFATVGDSGNGVSRFPHQSTGWKLLFDEATMTGGTSDLAGDPQRVIPRMDVICLSCHAVFEDLDVASAVTFCLNCHDSKYGAPDVGDEIRKASGMGITDIDRDHASEEGVAANFSASGNRHAQCYDCHNAQAIYPWDDTPLTGMWGVSITAETTNTTPTLLKVDQVNTDDQTELCFKCHSSGSGWNLALPDGKYYRASDGTTLPTENKAFAFNTKNSAFHPVRAQGRNQSTALNSQLASATAGYETALTTTSRIKCTDCHNSDETSATQGPASNSSFRPSGPHGSDYAPILRANYWTDVDNTDSLPSAPENASEAAVTSNFALCFMCHDKDKLLSNVQGVYATNFSEDGGRNLHWKHLIDIGKWDFFDGQVYGSVAACRVCHNDIHSNQQANNTLYAYNLVGPNVNWQTVAGPGVAGIKTRLINFAPVIVTKSSQAAPMWRMNNNPSEVLNRERACFLTCHFQAGGNESNMTMSSSNKYIPSTSLDDDSMFY